MNFVGRTARIICCNKWRIIRFRPTETNVITMYTNLRCNLIKPYYWRKPSVFKLLQLFNITNVKQLFNLGKYICRALKLRADTL
jgi:hypothetical protein